MASVQEVTLHGHKCTLPAAEEQLLATLHQGLIHISCYGHLHCLAVFNACTAWHTYASEAMLVCHDHAFWHLQRSCRTYPCMTSHKQLQVANLLSRIASCIVSNSNVLHFQKTLTSCWDLALSILSMSSSNAAASWSAFDASPSKDRTGCSRWQCPEKE